MHDDKLSDFGSERLRELADERTGDPAGVGDKIRYWVVLASEIATVAAVLVLLAAVGMTIFTQSFEYVQPIGNSLLWLVVAAVVKWLFAYGTWWYDD